MVSKSKVKHIVSVQKERRNRKKKTRNKWNQLYFQPIESLNVIPDGEKKRSGFRMFNELACKKCKAVFRTPFGLKIHTKDIHGQDLEEDKQKSTGKKTLKRFWKDAEDSTSEEVYSEDDEFNEKWEEENLSNCNKVATGKKRGSQRCKPDQTPLPEVQVYQAGEWDWMPKHPMFSPRVLLFDSLNVAYRNEMMAVNQHQDTEERDDDVEIIEDEITTLIIPKEMEDIISNDSDYSVAVFLTKEKYIDELIWKQLSQERIKKEISYNLEDENVKEIVRHSTSRNKLSLNKKSAKVIRNKHDEPVHNNARNKHNNRTTPNDIRNEGGKNTAKYDKNTAEDDKNTAEDDKEMSWDCFLKSIKKNNRNIIDNSSKQRRSVGNITEEKHETLFEDSNAREKHDKSTANGCREDSWESFLRKPNKESRFSSNSNKNKQNKSTAINNRKNKLDESFGICNSDDAASETTIIDASGKNVTINCKDNKSMDNPARTKSQRNASNISRKKFNESTKKKTYKVSKDPPAPSWESFLRKPHIKDEDSNYNVATSPSSSKESEIDEISRKSPKPSTSQKESRKNKQSQKRKSLSLPIVYLD